MIRLIQDIENLGFILFYCLPILASITLLISSFKRKERFDTLISLTFLIPFLAFTIASAFEVRWGHAGQYLYLFPGAILSMVRTAIILNISKKIRLSIFLFFALVGFHNYFNLYDEFAQHFLYKEKSHFLIRDPLTLNVFFASAHPFQKEVALYYGKIHKNIQTTVIGVPAGPRDFGAFATSFVKYKNINLIYFENDALEAKVAREVIAIVNNAYNVKDVKYHNVEAKNHAYGIGPSMVIKNIFFSRY